MYMKEANVVQGYPDGTYRPQSTSTRAEFLKMVIESSVAKSEIEECVQTFPMSAKYAYFRDVKKHDWFVKYVCIAKQKGIVSGYPDKTFKPNNTITFAEAAKIIVVTFGYETPYDAIWYKPYIEILQSKNAIPSSLSSCHQKIYRGEIAEILRRIEEHITDKSSSVCKELEA